MDKYSQTVVRWLCSRQFFVMVVLLFVLEAVWIAVSGRYPMAFDEDFHLGIIQIYAHHLSPIFAHQPSGADSFGAVARDPSYLYHYLMSFPWRLITMLTHNFMIQVIFVRLINIGFFAVGIVLFRRIMLKTKASKAIINVVMLFFVLTPIVPLVAAQINYDNLLIPLTGLSFLFALRLVEHLHVRKEVDYTALALLLTTCMIASLVKYAFLPIFAALGIYIGYQLYKGFEVTRKQTLHHLVGGYKQISLPIKLLLIVLVVLCSGLFAERYGVNFVRYKTPIPECDQVLSIAECTSYGAWNRNYLFERSKADKTNWNPVGFTDVWARKLAFNLLFTLNGIQSGFGIGKPLPLPRLTARAIVYIGLPLTLLYARKIFRDKTLRWLLFVAAVYILALWLQNYSDFLHLGQQVAVQGRYLLPVLPFIYLVVGLAYAHLLRRKQQLKLALATIVALCFILGGGALTFILHSDPSWYWPNQNIINANQAVQHILGPIIPGSHFVQV